jgi:peptidoglycan/LPS O-acetylase OafA/YrhL
LIALPAVEGRSQPQRGFGYKPSLDGVRAMAVLAVMLYHARVGWAPGGFLGVDAFFVLSGYLITSLMLFEVRATGRLDLRAFWLRRGRRLLPALILVLVAVAAYAAFVALPSQIDALRGDGVATLFYVANWRQVFLHHSYFDLFRTPSLLQHTWSLAIEEQWYLIWPLLLPLIVRRTGGRPGRLLLVIGGLAVGSAVLMGVLYHPGHDPSRVYYGTDTRAQALLVGAALAVLLLWRPPRVRRTRVLLQVSALGAVAFLGVLWTTTSDHAQFLYRGGFPLEALAVALVIAAAVPPARGLVPAGLSFAPLRWVGLISYGLYLWHWPVDVYLSEQRTGLHGTSLLWARLGVTFAIAAASYVLVERPIRRGALRRRPRVGRVLVPATIAAVLAALIVSTSNIAGLGERRQAAARTQDIVNTSRAALEKKRVQQQVLAKQANTVTALFVGDSVSQSLATAYAPELHIPRLAVQSVAHIGCGIARGRILPVGGPFGQQDCSAWPDQWRYGVELFHPSVSVMLIGTWEVFDREIDGRELKFGSPEYAAYLRGELERGLRILTEFGAPVVVMSKPCNSEAEHGSLFGWTAVIPELNAMLREFADAHRGQVSWIDLNGFVCPLSKWDRKLPGVDFFPDGMHFSPVSGEVVWRWLGPQLAQIANRSRGVAWGQPH